MSGAPRPADPRRVPAGNTILREFVRNPREVGAVRRSSRALGDTLANAVRWPAGGTVVEAGAGDGAVTESLLAAKPDGVRFLAVELNPTCAEALRTRLPDVRVIVDDLVNLPAICDREEVGRPDVVVATLPWSLVPRDRQLRLSNAMLAALAPGGQLLFYIYAQALPFWRRSPFARILESRFARVEQGTVIWKNLPPAVVVDCRGLR